MKVLIFGLGYSCLYFVRSGGLAAKVVGTTTRRENAALLSGEGIRTAFFDGVAFDDWLPGVIADCDAAIVSVPPETTGDPVFAAFAPALRAAPRLTRIVYLSTIGVYGDHGGAWIDEDTPPRAVSSRSRGRLAAESAWRRLGEESGKAAHLLRLAGIYGPRRNALVALAEGKARRIVKPGQAFNRIHVEDIARTISACLASELPGGIWNVADDEPTPGADVVEYAARLLKVPPPPEIAFEAADLSAMARSFYGESRRASNRRLKQDLGVRLAFPSYREGLRSLHAAGEGATIPLGANP